MNKNSSYTGFISGGLMGSDPFHPSSWSGSSRSLFLAMQRHDILQDAFGVDIPKWQFALQALPNISANREVWRRRVYRSVAYRQSLEAVFQKVISEKQRTRPLLQLGAYVNASAHWDAPIFTYQDGNAAEYINSPFAPAQLRTDTRRNAQLLDYEKQVAQSAELVLTTSEYLAQSFQHYYDIPSDKVINISCGINVPVPTCPPERDYSNAEILFIGREFHRKGGEEVVAAFAQIRRHRPKAKLHIVGPDRLDISGDNIYFHGFLNRDHEADRKRFNYLLSRATLFVLPSHYEPLGLAPLEAMGWGIPALVTGKWALAENVIPGQHGAHCDMQNAARLADQMIDLLEKPDQLANMGKAAHRYVQNKFNWDIIAQKLATLYPDC